MKEKICLICNIKKPISKFYKHPTCKDKLSPKCKQCCKKYNKQRNQKPETKKSQSEYKKKYLQQPENKEREIKYQARYYQNIRKAYQKTPKERKRRREYAKREKVVKYRKKYNKEYNQRPEVKERIKKLNQTPEQIEQIKKYRIEYSQRPWVKEKRKIYYQNNKEQISKRHKIYSTRPDIKKRTNKYLAKKRQNDSKFHLNGNMRTAIYISLKGNKNGRHWEDIVGYTLQELKSHLEKQFDKNMDWSNYGSYWHIDHIKPQSLFNFTHPEDKEFKKCWALSNLQPLEAIENIKKGNRFIDGIYLLQT